MARQTKAKAAARMTICGTDEYMAPEVIMGEEYNDKADVFSFGEFTIPLLYSPTVILVLLFFGQQISN
jgi:serine/threonine protein kinase